MKSKVQGGWVRSHSTSRPYQHSLCNGWFPLRSIEYRNRMEVDRACKRTEELTKQFQADILEFYLEEYRLMAQLLDGEYIPDELVVFRGGLSST